jgi:hypothetical protein
VLVTKKIIQTFFSAQHRILISAENNFVKKKNFLHAIDTIRRYLLSQDSTVGSENRKIICKVL